jgi:excisionase family DNA binding protein
MPDRPEGQDRLLHPLEAQAVLNCGRRKFRELTRSGALRVVRLGPKTVRVRESDLRAFIAGLGQVLGAMFVLLLAFAAMTPEDRARVEEWVYRTRTEQGLPPHLEDPALLAELAAEVLESSDDRPAPKEQVS